LSLTPPFLNAEAKIKFPLFIPLAAAHAFSGTAKKG